MFIRSNTQSLIYESKIWSTQMNLHERSFKKPICSSLKIIFVQKVSGLGVLSDEQVMINKFFNFTTCTYHFSSHFFQLMWQNAQLVQLLWTHVPCIWAPWSQCIWLSCEYKNLKKKIKYRNQLLYTFQCGKYRLSRFLSIFGYRFFYELMSKKYIF